MQFRILAAHPPPLGLFVRRNIEERSEVMAAYTIINLQVTDPDSFREFQEKFPAVLEKYEGKYLARGGEVGR
jgi:hypothetical protein